MWKGKKTEELEKAEATTAILMKKELKNNPINGDKVALPHNHKQSYGDG